jgi:hypothetical protein
LQIKKTIIATLLSRIASEKAKIKSVKLFFTLYRVLCTTAHSAFPQVLKSLQLSVHRRSGAGWQETAVRSSCKEQMARSRWQEADRWQGAAGNEQMARSRRQGAGGKEQVARSRRQGA